MHDRQREPNPHKNDKDSCKALCWALKRAEDVLKARKAMGGMYPPGEDPHDHAGQIQNWETAVKKAEEAVEEAKCCCEKYKF